MSRRNEKLLAAQHYLEGVMGKEISVMRDLLASMEDERQALMSDETMPLRELMNKRQGLLEKITQVRLNRIEAVKELVLLLGIHTSSDGQGGEPWMMSKLLDHRDMDSCHLLSLRDQILALLEKMNDYNTRNAYLLERNVEISRGLTRRLIPRVPTPAYSMQVAERRKPKSAVATMIHPEGRYE